MTAELCQVCEKKTPQFQFLSSNNKMYRICIPCLRGEIKAGKIKSLDEFGNHFIVDLIETSVESFDKRQKQREETKRTKSNTAPQSESRMSILEAYGKNLTQFAKEGKLSPLIGREQEIRQIVQVLSRKEKNNPILTGEPGVGKTAIMEGVAQKIVQKQVPKDLYNKEIYTLDMNLVVAGTKFRGEFEQRLKEILQEVRKNRNIILFIDEIHTIVGAGSAEGGMDASNIFKPALSRGEVTVVGATTVDEYQKYFERDAALERRFTKIHVQEPTGEQTQKILAGLRSGYESFHRVKITDEALDACVHLSMKYIGDRFFPDKAIDLMDEACAAKKMSMLDRDRLEGKYKELEEVKQNRKRYVAWLDEEQAKMAVIKQKEIEKEIAELEIQEDAMMFEKNEDLLVRGEDIASIVSEWTGIPVTRLSKSEKEKLRHLDDLLKKELIGQDEAVEKIARSIKRNQIGMKDPNRPAGVFMLVGPTGVGKTELAKQLAKHVYGSQERMIRVDMSEYMEKSSIARLIGSPPGYVGYEEGGELTQKLRQAPYSLILLDEIEKAHPDVFNLFLQVFEDGRVTDAKGRVISAKNAIILMTSNEGSEFFRKQQGSIGYSFGEEDQTEQKQNRQKEAATYIIEKVKEKYKPEFINRLDEILIFNPLEKENMAGISRKLMDELKEQVAAEQSITLSYSRQLIEFLVNTYHQEEYGARPLRRGIDEIRNLIADVLIEEDEVKKIAVSVKNGEVQAKSV